MDSNKMTQSQIDALLKESDLEDSVYKQNQTYSKPQQKQQYSSNYQTHQQPQNNDDQDYERGQTSNQYGQDEFESYQQSKRTDYFNKNNNTNNKNIKLPPKSSAYDSYAQEQFQSYEESRKTKEFERSQPNNRFNKKPQSQNINSFKNQKPHNNTTKLTDNQKNQSPPNKDIQSFHKQNNQIIKQNNYTQPQQPKSKTALIKTQQPKDNKNLPYNYTRLQQRQRQLLFTTLTEQNKKLKQLLAERDKQLTAIKTKYNILLEQKAQVLGNAKEATLKKQLQTLQAKYDNVLKQKTKQRAYKTAQMSKTMNNNFILQDQAEERQQQLLVIIQKLKERLVSTDKQLKTLHQKMNEGLDYQQELQRKLKRVEQLQLRMQKMKIQADEDRALIQMLKQKTKQQKNIIQALKEQKNTLNLCLKRAEMTQAMQNDFKIQLQEVKREKELLEKSLKEISMNFTTNLLTVKSKTIKKPDLDDVIEDSNELLSYNKK